MIVVDASVGGKWLLKIDESYREKALEILEKHSNAEVEITVPDLFFYEVANALATKTTISSHQTSPLLKKLYAINLTVYHPTDKDILTATKKAKKYKTTVYDMLYATVAKKNDTTLVTADEKFIEKTGFKFVKHIKDF